MDARVTQSTHLDIKETMNQTCAPSVLLGYLNNPSQTPTLRDGGQAEKKTVWLPGAIIRANGRAVWMCVPCGEVVRKIMKHTVQPSAFFSRREQEMYLDQKPSSVGEIWSQSSCQINSLQLRGNDPISPPRG